MQDKLKEHITPEDFGAVADWNGTTGTDNYTAFVAAISAAVSSKLPLKLTGRYYVEFSGSRDRLSVSGDLVLCGTSRDVSEIKFGPANVAKAIRGFDVAGGANFTIRDLKLTSPTLSVFPLFDNLYSWAPVWYTTSGDHRMLTIERCYFGDQWYATMVSGGAAADDFRIVLRESYFQGYNAAMNVAQNLTTKPWLIADNCVFQGHMDEGSNWTTRGHCLYPHPHFSLKLTGCRFQGGGRSMINHFSTSGIDYTHEPPEVVSLKDCIFFNPFATAGDISAMLTSNTDAFTVLENCTFDHCAGVLARCDTVLIGCTAVNGGTLGGPYFSGVTDSYMRSMQFVNCRGHSDTVGQSLIFTNDADVTSPGTMARIIVDGGYFKIAAAPAIAHTSTVTLEVMNATFDRTAGGFGAMTNTGGGLARISDCRFIGAFSSQVCLSVSGGSTYELIDNTFDISTVGGVINPYNAPAETFRGRGNSVVGASIFGSANPQNLRPKEGRHTVTLASAGTLTLTQNANYYRVSGSAAIAAINMGPGNDYNFPFSGVVYLVVDAGGSWSLSAASNIVPITTGARTAGEVVQLYYDPVGAKWYEV